MEKHRLWTDSHTLLPGQDVHGVGPESRHQFDDSSRAVGDAGMRAIVCSEVEYLWA